MANCKDCLGFEFCLDRLGTTKYYDNAIAANNVEELCQKFKDRNRFVELPCKLGETFYTIDRRSDKKQVRDYFAEEITICVVRGVENGRYTVLKNCFDFKIKPLRKKIITDMSNIFLTYKEADKALKELKNNET